LSIREGIVQKIVIFYLDISCVILPRNAIIFDKRAQHATNFSMF